jgi:hypothetical protein
MSYESTLRDVLERKNPELSGRLPKIKDIATTLLSYTQGKFPYYTPHDFSHSLNVEENLNWLIPDKVKEQMAPNEIFFLIIAAWMHDWGMVGKQDENPEDIRAVHNIRTETYFEEMFSKLFLTEHEGRLIGRISRGHTKSDLSSNDYDDEVYGASCRIRKRFLSALLRIADECDITHNRTPEVLYFTLNPTAKSKEEFEKHLSIAGVGQLDEKHKIYISATVRDPHGAKLLRLVQAKVQKEIDSVKGILSSNDIILDTVELKMQTRGFVDKPIGFDVDKKKIVELLIGEHLYKNHDAAIRELVQNAIDACRGRKELESNVAYKITISKPNEQTLIIEDNGIGMDYITAKNYLSVIGDSFYSSKEFVESIKGRTFEPISQFGIGILSSFLICDGMTIETKKKDQEPCKFVIGTLDEDWTYQVGKLEESGTKIQLNLNESGKKINIKKTLEKYFISTEIDVFYQDNFKILKFESDWASSKICDRFSIEKYKGAKTTDVLCFETDRYQLILAQINGFSPGLFLFNHGVFVNHFYVTGLSGRYFICLNSIKNQFDLHISRENIIENEKWFNFLLSVFNDLFDYARKSSKNKNEYIDFIKSTIESRASFSVKKNSKLFEKEPFLISALQKAIFPISSYGQPVEYCTIDELPNSGELKIYQSAARESTREFSLILNILRREKLTIINPYKFPLLEDKRNNSYEDCLTAILNSKQTKSSITDLNDLLVNNSTPVVLSPEISRSIPPNITLVRFPDKWSPVILIKKPAEVFIDPYYLGSAYWGNILLWKRLLTTEANKQILDMFERWSPTVSCVNLSSEPVVCIDAEDEFIKQLLNVKVFTSGLIEKIKRYFFYLSYLPLVLANFESSVIFLEVISVLEKEISEELKLVKVKPLVMRFKPEFSLYLHYFEHKGENKIYTLTNGT